MMRGQRSAAVAVRAPSGTIVLHEERFVTPRPVARWPFVRGVVLLWEMLVLGSRMMMFAASIAQGQAQPAASKGAANGEAEVNGAREGGPPAISPEGGAVVETAVSVSA